MNKKELKNTMVITSLVLLIPMIVGVILWSQLPETIATHFGMNNQANGCSSKTFTVFGIPLVMLAIQWVCFLATFFDPKKKNISLKLIKNILWLVPLISLSVMLSIYSKALGFSINVGTVSHLLVGFVFIMIGNYLHKVKQNYTIGIKIPWTLNSKENWNKTNRLSAWLFVIGGLVFLLNSYFLNYWIMAIVIGIIVFVPVGYSFLLFKKGI